MNPDDKSFASLFESGPKRAPMRRVRMGEVLDLEVVRITPTAVLVALDGKQEGFVDPAELKNDEGKLTIVVGSRIAVKVSRIDRGTGEVQLTPLSTEPIVEGGAPGTPAAGAEPSSVVVGLRVKGKVTGVERYGVFLEFPVAGEQRAKRGLVPTPELGAPRGADLRKMFPLGKELEAAVIAIDEKGRLRLSVVALTQADERNAFQSYAAKQAEPEAGGKKERRGSGFGTFADLLKQKK